MKNSAINRCIWLGLVYSIRACGLPFQLSPVKIPRNEGAKLSAAAAENEVIIIFNAGGWGDTPLSQAFDFAPILTGLQQTLTALGYTSTIVPYIRTLPGLGGRMAGIKEQLNSFKHCSRVQIRDIQKASAQFPQKQFLLVGFSVGGGLSGKTLPEVAGCPNVYGITVGAPGWFRTYSSEKSLVLDNSHRDPLVVGDILSVASALIKWPFFWLKYRLKRHNVKLAMALQFANHKYAWASVEVGPPVVRFIEEHFPARQSGINR
jgi:hypothetical protein